MVRLLCTTRSVHCILKPLCRNSIFCLQHLHQSAILRDMEYKCEFEAFKSGHCSGTMEDVRNRIRNRIGLDGGYHAIPKCRSDLLKYQPKREDLPERTMKDSFTTVLLPLSLADARDRYVNHLGRVRMGRIMEEMDLFAVWICHRHINLPTLPKGIPLPYVFVTLLVDKVDFLNINNIMATDDINLSGHVSWTGTSSLEITIYMQQKYRTIAKGILMMVARNATNTGPAPINALKPANEEEKRCLKASIKRQRERRKKHGKSVLNVRPSDNDESLMYNIFRRIEGIDSMNVKARELPPNCRWMAESFQTTMLHPFPDNRNSHNTIFGGYVMRNAVEISFITGCIYAGGRPLIECILDVAFYSPVKVNSFLKITSYVVYTFEKYMQLMTIVQVMDANSMEQVTTNAFHLTYKAERNVKEVLPATYQETLWYINGRNKFLTFLQIREERQNEMKAQSRQK